MVAIQRPFVNNTSHQKRINSALLNFLLLPPSHAPQSPPRNKQMEMGAKKEDAAAENEKANKEEDSRELFLEYKTWVFKVSLHCQGCCREVKKTLQQLDGVYHAEVELATQKVTVIANINLKAETVIKKLAKLGKMAEPWPENRDHDDEADEETVEEVKTVSNHTTEPDMEEDGEVGLEYGRQTGRCGTPEHQESMARRCCCSRKEEQKRRNFISNQRAVHGCSSTSHSQLHQLVPTMHAVSYNKAYPNWNYSPPLYWPQQSTGGHFLSDMEVKSSSEENQNTCSIN